MFWQSMAIVGNCRTSDNERSRLSKGSLSRLLRDEARLSPPSEREKTIWIIADSTLMWMGGISWNDRGMFGFLPRSQKNLLHMPQHGVIISECELSVATLGALLWGVRRKSPRIAAVCADNRNVPHWLEYGKVKPGDTCKISKRLLTWCVQKGVEIIPRFVRSGRNLSADGLTRWPAQECEEWRVGRNLTHRDIPGEWTDWEREWYVHDDSPPVGHV